MPEPPSFVVTMSVSLSHVTPGLVRGSLRTAISLLLVAVVLLCAPAFAQQTMAHNSQPGVADRHLSVASNRMAGFAAVVDKIIERERQLRSSMRYFHPLAETYLQNIKSDPDLGTVPVSDQYFMGKLDLGQHVSYRTLLRQSRPDKLLGKVPAITSWKYSPLDFVQVIVLDDDGFDRRHYSFSFVRREMLGDLRCLVIQVVPLADAGNGRFVGRIWVEEEGYHIVRFNGTYTPQEHAGHLEFDCWRLNVLPGLWLPAYVYSQESDEHGRFGHRVRFRAQTRLWGYDLQHAGDHQEYKQPFDDMPFLGDASAGQDLNPLLSRGSKHYPVDDNIVERLQVAGLMAHHGDVDTVLETVARNILITNELLDKFPDVRCRVLLTTPLESFTIGHTIVVSRGLLDVLPDEASLAAVLAHELGHMVLGDPGNVQYGFPDRLLLRDEEIFERFDFHQERAAEKAADTKALELLRNSPYKDHLQTAGLFFKVLKKLAPELPNLVHARLGNALFPGREADSLKQSAPALVMTRTDQIAALPLGARIRLDPWTDRIELIRTRVAPLTAREKMPFGVTPFSPHLKRAAVESPQPSN
jgi:hypothetical protein